VITARRYVRLPHLPAMTPGILENTIASFRACKPFKPFLVELANGTSVKIDDPRAIVVRAGIGAYLSPTGAPTIFDYTGVDRITECLGT
jgi:hypothetical protein